MISSAALKYARALLDVASADGAEDSVLRELQAVGALLHEHEELRTTLENPVLPFPSKRAIVEALGPKIPIGKSVQNFLLVVINNARIGQVDDLVEAFSQVLDETQGVRRGTVFSAKALVETQQKQVTRGMEDIMGGQVRLDFKKDENLIGGIKIRIGSTIYDGSIRARLNELEKRLVDH